MSDKYTGKKKEVEMEECNLTVGPAKVSTCSSPIKEKAGKSSRSPDLKRGPTISSIEVIPRDGSSIQNTGLTLNASRKSNIEEDPSGSRDGSRRILDSIELMDTDSEFETRWKENSVSATNNGMMAASKGAIRKTNVETVSMKRKNRGSPGSPELSRLTPQQRSIIHDKLKDIHLQTASELGVNVIEWVDKTEDRRRRSSLQGGLSGNMKVNLRLIKDGVEELARRANKTGDVELHRRELLEAKNELSKIKEENYHLYKKVELLEVRGEENREMQGRIEEAPLRNYERVDMNKRTRFGSVSDVAANDRISNEGRGNVYIDPDGEINNARKKLSLISMAENSVEEIKETVRGVERNEGGARARGGRGANQSILRKTRERERIENLRRRRTRSESSARDTDDTKRGMPERYESESDRTPRSKSLPRGAGGRGVSEGRAPRQSIVLIISYEGGPSYGSILSRARREIVPRDIGIEETRIRRAISGGIIIQVNNDGIGEKARRLAERLRIVINDDRVRISTPIRTTSIRISGLDDSIIEADIKVAISNISGEDCDEIKISRIGIARNGLGTAIVTCQASIAYELLNQGNIKIGWSMVRISEIPPRRVKCYRCMASGHTSHRCPSSVDRTGACFNCGYRDHKAVECNRQPRCPVCVERLPANHRAGDEELCPPCPPGPLKVSRGPSTSPNSRGNDNANVMRGSIDVIEQNMENIDRIGLRPEWQ